jgi:hypothetical protein
MNKSTSKLLDILADLRGRARSLGITDTEWAARAGVRHETLSRLRHRESCDFTTLRNLATVVGTDIAIVDGHAPRSTEDGLYPAGLDRKFEERLLGLCASGILDAEHWRRHGPAFFMAGLAVMIASTPEFDRRAYLNLAELLHAGSTQSGVFAMWLERSPVRPSRFLPMLTMQTRHAA